MITVDVEHRKARIWIGELPDLGYQVIALAERTTVVGTPAITNARCAAVELFRQASGPSSYGLLGATFTPNHTGQLVLQVAISVPDERQVDWALAARVDRVRVGLPKEYANAVLDEASDTEDIRLFGSGTLYFGCGAHGVIGSSPVMFRWLARAVVRLLTLTRDPMSAEELITLLQLRARPLWGQ